MSQTCIKCGSQYPDDFKFCQTCGTTIDSAGNAAVATDGSRRRMGSRGGNVSKLSLLIGGLIMLFGIWKSSMALVAVLASESGNTVSGGANPEYILLVGWFTFMLTGLVIFVRAFLR